MNKIIKTLLVVILLLPGIIRVNAQTDAEKNMRGVGYYFEEPVLGKELDFSLNICILGVEDEKFCEEYPATWQKSDNPENNNPTIAPPIADKIGYYTISGADSNSSGETMTDLINRLTMTAVYAGYNMDLDTEKFILEVNKISMPYSNMGSSDNISPLTFAVGGIDKIEYTVPKLVTGKQPPKTVTIKTTPEEATLTNDAEVVWSKSTDGKTFEEMSETDVLENGLYYRYTLKDEKNVFKADYITTNGIFVDSYSQNFVNGEEKEVKDAIFQSVEPEPEPEPTKPSTPTITEPNPETGNIESYITLGILSLMLITTLVMLRKRHSN